MVEHSATITVKAPLHQVYMLFTHFHDFPKFMSFVREVTYYDNQRSHWVINARGDYAWDAVNENWIPDKQVGWRSTHGLANFGIVKFNSLGPERTSVNVYIHYTPPSHLLGSLGERLGITAYFDAVLQKDLANFARMVEETPAGALDPMSSHYLFHAQSAVEKKEVTERQQEAMQRDPMMQPQALTMRKRLIEQEKEQKKQELARETALRELHKREEALHIQEQQSALLKAAELSRRERITREEAQRKAESIPLDPRLVYAALAHALGDKDGMRARDPNSGQDPMTSRRITDKITKKISSGENTKPTPPPANL